MKTIWTGTREKRESIQSIWEFMAGAMESGSSFANILEKKSHTILGYERRGESGVCMWPGDEKGRKASLPTNLCATTTATSSLSSF